ncbi:MAG: DNRLRE domain-containing protein [Candidatus Hermodarchaeota archaeon]
MKSKTIIFLIISFTFVLLLFIPIARASTETIQVKEDAYVRSSLPDDNYGDTDYINVGAIFNDPLCSYIQFDISSLENSEIERISLRLRVSYFSGVFVDGKVSLVENNWVEETITYNSQPSTIEFIRDISYMLLSEGDIVTISLDQEYFDNGNYISFKLEGLPSSSANFVSFDSKEAGVPGNAPTLVIRYPEPSNFEFPLWIIPIIIIGPLVGVGAFFEYKYFRKISRVEPQRGSEKLDNN